MKCKWSGCDNEVTGKAKYCSGGCRVKQSRSVTSTVTTRKVSHPVPSVTKEAVSVTPTPIIDTVKADRSPETRRNTFRLECITCDNLESDEKDAACCGGDRICPVSLDDYNDANGRTYAFRPCAEKLNWGPWMSADELTLAGLSANRVIIPGDWDYDG